jgi:hypothetical protein
MTEKIPRQFFSPFNSSVEIGLRSLCVLTTAFPAIYSLQRLVVFDYFLVHSDDIDGGPTGLHPKTPHRGGEILVRRNVLQEGLTLYESRGLIECIYREEGIFFSATDKSADFLDAMNTDYLMALRQRANWVVDSFGRFDDASLDLMVSERIGVWGAEFSMESVLWTEENL